VTLADESVTRRIGTTVAISTKCKDIAISHCFEVMETGGTGVILGRDLFDKFGIGLSGLPVDFPQEAHELESKLVPIKTSSQEEGNKLDLRNYLNPLLEINQRITLPCKFPGSELTLKFNQDYKGPIIKRQYPIPHHSKLVVDDWIVEQLSLGHIAELHVVSSWNSPLLVVPKKDLNGGIKAHRVCIDPRHINLILESNSFPLPLIREIFESLKGMSFFSKIDLESGFNQFPLHAKSQEITTFTWNSRQYVFTVCPFGFKLVPAHFQQIMSKILGKFKFVKVYIDDIIIHSTSYLEHKSHLSQVFEELNSFNLKAKLGKCEFGLSEIIILGYKISAKGIQVCKEKLLQMKRWPIPKTGKELQSQLGFINYFRDLIPLYAELLAPLESLRSSKIISWKSEYTAIYDKVQSILSSDLVL
jgi:hypothetical protein